MASKKEEAVTPLRQSVVITGASKGLGEALARLYAHPGRTLGLLGRDRQRLEAVAARCRNQGAHVVIAALDVKDEPMCSSSLNDPTGDTSTLKPDGAMGRNIPAKP